MSSTSSADYLRGLVAELCKLPDETSWVEFKHNNTSPEEIGTYLSALSNAAALDGKENAFVVWGVEDGSREIVGTDFEHNRRGVMELFTHVVPRLSDLQARLWIVGDVSATFRARAARESGGRVRAVPAQSDLTPWLWGCDVGLNPITTGAGSNVKLPTYLACGLEVVTTPFGARGFERLLPFVTRAELDGFATALTAAPPSRAGRDPVLASYAWGEQARTLLAAYESRLAGVR